MNTNLLTAFTAILVGISGCSKEATTSESPLQRTDATLKPSTARSAIDLTGFQAVEQRTGSDGKIVSSFVETSDVGPIKAKAFQFSGDALVATEYSILIPAGQDFATMGEVKRIIGERHPKPSRTVSVLDSKNARIVPTTLFLWDVGHDGCCVAAYSFNGVARVFAYDPQRVIEADVVHDAKNTPPQLLQKLKKAEAMRKQYMEKTTPPAK